MKKNYISPLCEAIHVNASCDLLAGSPAPVSDVYLPVAHGATTVVAD